MARRKQRSGRERGLGVGRKQNEKNVRVSAWKEMRIEEGIISYRAISDEKKTDRIAGDLVVTDDVPNERGKIMSASAEDFIRRLRQVQLPPRPASNNIESREAMAV